MAEWQYKSNKIPVDKGYAVNLPNRPESNANEKRHTGYLEDQDGQRMYLWIHQIDSSFQIGGSAAQSARYRRWYPRNFVQPRFSLTGQCQNEAQYGLLCEFIRKCQDKSLRWDKPSGRSHTVKLVLPGKEGHPYRRDYVETNKHSRQGYVLFGHIPAIKRTAERFVNAPEYSFEFLISFSHQGLFETKTTDSEAALRKLAPWMDIFHNKDRSTYQNDPDTYFGPDSWQGQDRPN